MKQPTQIRLAALILFLGITLGAFGAHGLKNLLNSTGHLATWSTAVLYHLIHGLAMFSMSLFSKALPQTAYWSWLLGIVLFSGSLYILSVTGISQFAAITPLGGLAFLIGWGSLILFPNPKER